MKINGAALRAIREATGHSQLSLAKSTGISQGRISELEAGDKKRGGAPIEVRPDTVLKLRTGLGCPASALIVPEAEPGEVA
jgi:transcriptional regulator with XRE-family HTH domain